MSSELTKQTGPIEPRSHIDPKRVYDLFLSSRRERTREVYKSNFADFAQWMREPQQSALRRFFSSRATANHLALEYRESMRSSSAPQTINNKLSTLRQLTKVARQAGLIEWDIDIENVKEYRSERKRRAGPNKSQVEAVLEYLTGRTGIWAKRDLALFALLYGAGLRVGEVVQINTEDVDCIDGFVKTRRKGQDKKEEVPICDNIASTLSAHLVTHPSRGKMGMPLFYSNRGPDCRITTAGIRHILRGWASACGITSPLRPHGLRHSGATSVIDQLGIAAAQCYCGHSKPETTTAFYDDSKDKRALEAQSYLLDNQS